MVCGHTSTASAGVGIETAKHRPDHVIRGGILQRGCFDFQIFLRHGSAKDVMAAQKKCMFRRNRESSAG
jgi:hypothetical protein